MERDAPLVGYFAFYPKLSPEDWAARLLPASRMRELVQTPIASRAPRWALIELPTPVVHPSLCFHPFHPIEKLLGIWELNGVLFGADDDQQPAFVVDEPGDSGFSRSQVISWAQRDKGHRGLVVSSGAPPLRARLAALNPASPPPDLGPEGREVLDLFARVGARPDWMTPDAFPVLYRPPPDVAPRQEAVLARAQRVRRLIELDSPTIILDSQRAFLQKDIDSLFVATTNHLEELASADSS